MSRTVRLRRIIGELLRDHGPMSTVEIYDRLNERLSWGATMSQIGNIMGKDRRFVKTGQVSGVFRVGRYQVCTWDLDASVSAATTPPVMPAAA